MPFRSVSLLRASGLAVAAGLVLGGCTTFQTVTTGSATPPAGGASAPTGATGPGGAASGLRPPGASPTAAAPAPGALRPFAEVIKDAKRSDGPFAVWQKDDKVWLEIKPSDLNVPFIFSPKLKTGIAERGFFGGYMQESGMVEFRRVFNQIQVVWINTDAVAKKGTPEGFSVEASYSPSLLASAPVLSAPEPERKSFLVDAGALFLADLPALGMALQRSYRQGYSFDPRNSAITKARSTPELLVIEVLAHYATASIAVPQPGTPPNIPQPSAPKYVPDPRSLFFNLHYSLARLPDVPMAGRKSDPRVGYFESSRNDFSSDLDRTPRQRFVDRWRLEKKDPSAALSEPVKPVTYWIDKTVPLKYRDSVKAGILEWNKAFEKIGFKDAIRVEIQPDDAEFDTLDLGRPSVRWMTNPPSGLGGIGPHHTDPRSGEILDADIVLESTAMRSTRTFRSQVMSIETGAFVPQGLSPLEMSMLMKGRVCTMAEDAAEQMSYGLDVLEARGELEPDSPEAEAYAQAFLKDVTMHEVGHTLGLRHNFRSSRVYTVQQLADPAFVRANGLTGSVMDYAPINLNGPGEAKLDAVAAFGDTLGPYDYWAIEYAYRPLPSGATAADEAAMLEKIAGRNAEPLLAYGTDEDNFIGIDPESLQFDLGSDAVAFAKKRIVIAQDLLKRQETRPLSATQEYSLLRRSVVAALRDVARAAAVLSRQIGGVRTVRDHPGTGRDPLTPVPVAVQRASLDVITGSLLAADGLRVSPALQRKLGADFAERTDAIFGGDGSTQTDFSPTAALLGLQRALLATLMSDTVATRLLESSEKAPAGEGRALRMPELYGRLTQAVWSELDSGGDIAPLRREVQRDHVNRISSMLLRPGSASRADTRSIVRQQAKLLLEKIRTASRRGGLSEESRAHLADSADSLEAALSAKLERAGA